MSGPFFDQAPGQREHPNAFSRELLDWLPAGRDYPATQEAVNADAFRVE